MVEMSPFKGPEALLTVSNVTEVSSGLENHEPTALETDGATHTCRAVQVGGINEIWDISLYFLCRGIL